MSGRAASTVAFPLSLCRSCGQHFVLAAAREWEAVEADGAVVSGRQLQGIAKRSELQGEDAGEGLYFTDRLAALEEGDEAPGTREHLCRYCGASHGQPSASCRSAKCRRPGPLLDILTYPYPATRCPSCGARGSERSPVITPVRSSEAYDVMILAQTELASMPEEELRKLLIFADSRQDAAFQAGWMEGRSLRFRVRHLAYQILGEEPERWWYFEDLVRELGDRATNQGLVPLRGRGREPAIDRLRWLMIEELFAATERQRRNSLEQLGLAQLRYEGIAGAGLDRLVAEWGSRLELEAGPLADLLALLLDSFRLRHAVSHPHLGRWWSDRDVEVRDGIINAPEYFRPHLILKETSGDPKQRAFSIGFRSKRGATAGERLVAKALDGVRPEVVSDFLDAVWSWLLAERLLVPRRLKTKRFGKLEDLGGIETGYQVNLDLIQIAHAGERWLCNECGTARARSSPNGSCPAYNCRGTLQRSPRDENHYDVVQYTRFEFVPLFAREHSAQVPKEDRQQIERDFKRTGGRVNCLVATPTLEMGVDIGPLEMVLMRNVPPSPANYAQRSGRAGRRHRIGAIFTHCRDTQHDQYFYREPPAMIAGEVRIPAFSLRNEPLIRKHVHSAVLTALQSLDDPEEAVARAFPSYIWSYFGERGEEGERRRFLPGDPDLSPLRALIGRHEAPLVDLLRRVFTEQWPAEDREVVSEEALRRALRELPDDLLRVVRGLLAEIQAYREVLAEYRRIQETGELLSQEDERRRNSYERALQRLWGEEQDNYSLSYLARRGFFPGYALVRDAVRAQCLEPAIDVVRNLAVAIRELTPASRLYANRQQFKVRRLDFYKLKAGQADFDPSQLERTMVYEPSQDRVLVAAAGREGGEQPGVSFTSLQLIDVELEGLGRIADQEEYRFRVGYRQHAALLEEHRGGHGGTVGLVPFRSLREARLRLINLGPRSSGPASPGIGFPICTVCGETRSPFASQTEIDHFAERHQKRCGKEIRWHALHVDVASDLLVLGPFDDDGNAINALESLRIGARRVLEMGDVELEVELIKDDAGHSLGLLFDPMPGGSGLLPLVVEQWERVIAAAKDVLQRCDCDGACYRCLLHFRNQQHHGALDRHKALNALNECHGEFRHAHDIPPSFVEARDHREKADATTEEKFLAVLKAHSFPAPPEAQYKVDLGGGSRTVADFAYPEKGC